MNSLLDTARQLMTIQPRLRADIFDDAGKMFSATRDKILRIADYMIKKHLSKYKGCKVIDIVLVGSSAGYLYHDNSDLDVKIFLEITNPAIKHASPFIRECCNYGLFDNEEALSGLRIDGKGLDIAFRSPKYDNWGNYSVLENCWVYPPRKDFANINFSAADVVKGYYELCRRVYLAFSNANFDNACLDDENFEILQHLQNHILSTKERMLEGDGDFKDYLIFRLFIKRGNMKKMMRLLTQAQNDRILN